MKKLITFLLLAIISIFSLTGCSGVQTMGFKAQYWLKNVASTGYSPFSEVVEYDVKVVNVKPTNSVEYSNANLKMEVTSGTYTTKLSMKQDEGGAPYYLYETELQIEGKYVLDKEERPFNNNVKSSTKFKTIVDDFAPISSSKSSTDTTTVTKISNGYAVYNFRYNYAISYGDKNAETNYELSLIGEAESEPIRKDTVFKKYNEGLYVDNELLLLLPRAYSYDSSFTKEFTTIDVVTQATQKMAYSSTTQNTGSADVKSFNLKYLLNGDEVGSEDFKAARVTAYINETFSGVDIEAYYSVDHETHRHRMVKCYTPLNDSLGYLEYTIKSATQN